MGNASSKNEVFDKLLALDETLKLTDLRKAVLDIFIKSKKPISAYEVLDKLKKKRDSAEPTTVYRVIEYFLDRKILHRIDAENKYVFCTQLDHLDTTYHGIIFICRKCLTASEIMDKSVVDFLISLSRQHHFLIDDSLIEIKGTCNSCI